ITLAGTSPRCKLRLADTSVSSIHCSLLWQPDGLWVVDLRGKGGTIVRGKPVRCALLHDGDKLRVGRFVLRAHYLGTLTTGTVRTGGAAKNSDPVLDTVPSVKHGAGARKLAAASAQLAGDRRRFDEERREFELRLQQVEEREARLNTAQERLAAEWDK